jgi:hypothetical protein
MAPGFPAVGLILFEDERVNSSKRNPNVALVLPLPPAPESESFNIGETTGLKVRNGTLAWFFPNGQSALILSWRLVNRANRYKRAWFLT